MFWGPSSQKSYESIDDEVAMEYTRKHFWVVRDSTILCGAGSLYDELKRQRMRQKSRLQRISSELRWMSFTKILTQKRSKITAALTKMYAENVVPKYHPSFLVRSFQKIQR